MAISIEGRVQEGGLRATVRALAIEHGVAHEFAVDPQGRVRIVVEGERKAVTAFVAGLKKATSDTATSFAALWTAPSRH